APTVAEAPAAAPDSSGFAADHSGLDLTFGDQRVPYRVMGVFALPGESVPIEISNVDSSYRLEADSGTVESIDAGHWRWSAPASTGAVSMRVIGPAGEEAVTLNAVVMAPYTEMKHGMLHGYRIGDYPAPRPGHGDVYARPRGFIPITEATAGLLVSPHFQLIQFACKSGSGLPKFAVVQPRLLLRLEGLLQAA